jgi:DNA/RNA-binding domain of Phe-tRNA-synthetase-like protein
MYFQHSSEIWGDFPELVAGAVYASGIRPDVPMDRRLEELYAIAESRLSEAPEGEFPEVQAWRRVFSRMRLKPTQYRSASEALLRRYRKERTLPRIHPLIDLCNAFSLAYAIPIAVFDVVKIRDFLEVRYATGAETYLTFSGETEQPEPHEVIFADAAGAAHARRWTNRQSAASAVRDETSTALIVAEAQHEMAAGDVRRLCEAITGQMGEAWRVDAKMEVLSAEAPRFEY